jgi:hypothetical protein
MSAVVTEHISLLVYERVLYSPRVQDTHTHMSMNMTNSSCKSKKDFAQNRHRHGGLHLSDLTFAISIWLTVSMYAGCRNSKQTCNNMVRSICASGGGAGLSPCHNILRENVIRNVQHFAEKLGHNAMRCLPPSRPRTWIFLLPI